MEFDLVFPVGQARARPVRPGGGGSEPGPRRERRGRPGSRRRHHHHHRRRRHRHHLFRRRRSAPPRPGSDLRPVRNLRARLLQRHQPSRCGAGGAAAAAANEPGSRGDQQRAGQGRGPSGRAEGDGPPTAAGRRRRGGGGARRGVGAGEG